MWYVSISKRAVTKFNVSILTFLVLLMRGTEYSSMVLSPESPGRSVAHFCPVLCPAVGGLSCATKNSGSPQTPANTGEHLQGQQKVPVVSGREGLVWISSEAEPAAQTRDSPLMPQKTPEPGVRGGQGKQGEEEPQKGCYQGSRWGQGLHSPWERGAS